MYYLHADMLRIVTLSTHNNDFFFSYDLYKSIFSNINSIENTDIMYTRGFSIVRKGIVNFKAKY